MVESKGHFDKGRWVDDKDSSFSSPGPAKYSDIEDRLRSAGTQVGRGLDELIGAGNDLLTTQEGRQLLGKKLDTITGEIITTFEEIRDEGINFINKACDRIFK
jgi:hypothetical protein